MLRKIAAVVAGIIVTAVVLGIVQWIGQQVYPPPMGTDLNDAESLKNYVETAPFMALFFVILSYAAGAFCGGFTSTKIARDSSRAPAFIIGALFALISIYMMLTLPTPFWFWVLGLASWGLVLAGRSVARSTSSLQKN